MRAIREANAAAGFHFFEPATMRFFRSQAARRNCYPCDARACTYFVTSEQFTASSGWRAQRKYTIRAASWSSGDIRTVGTFQAYATRDRAERIAAALSRGAEEVQP
jgi:hypothetical protein